MNGYRVLLVGGTSHAGKSTVSQALAAKLGWDHLSTDRLARHPGRPWNTVPEHVAHHYRTLSPEELTAAQLHHYESMWPVIEATIAADTLVLEGSGIWPDRVAELSDPRVGAFWLTADAETLRRRIHTSSGYPDRTPDERHLVDKFVARTQLYDEQMREAIRRRGLPCIDVSTMSMDEVLQTAERLADL